MCCSAASLQLSTYTLHLSIKVTCISVWLYCIGSLLYNAIELQVRMKFCVFTKVSTFLVSMQVNKKSHILILSKYKYLYVGIASLANV